mmetsp:Transcript_21613/g.54401  ORF Transcript_21613/g.54401 Transcript_21613/m.54401 type:complete len:1025 (-) Transcript_21613:108-3182(-)
MGDRYGHDRGRDRDRRHDEPRRPSYEGGGDRQSYRGGRYDYHGRAQGGHRGGGRYGGTSGYGHAGGRGGGGRFDGRGGGRFGGRGGRGDIVFDPNAVPAEFSIGLGRPDPADDYAPAAPEPRRAEDAPSEVALVPMRRPGYGVAGTRVKLLANHFLVKCAGGTAVQHCVTITEILVEGNPNPFPGNEAADEGVAATPPSRVTPEEGRCLMAEVAARMRIPQGRWAYDGRAALYTRGRFPQDVADALSTGITLLSSNMRFRDLSTPKRNITGYTVSVKEVAVIDLDALNAAWRNGSTPDQEAVQCLDICLRHRLAMIPQVQMIRQAVFMHGPRQGQDIGCGVDMLRGFKQCVAVTEKGLTLAVDIAYAPFVRAMPLVDYMAAVLGENDPRRLTDALRRDPAKVKAVSKAIRGLKVKTTHMSGRNLTMKIRQKALDERGPSTFMFTLKKENRELSVEKYFAEQYGMRLLYPDLPCVNAGKKGTSFPPEVCEIVAGQRKLKLETVQKNLLPQYCTAKPQTCRRVMEHSVQRLGQFDNDPTSICFGAGVETSMMKVEGRYLPPPVLEYGLLETDRNYRPGADDNAQHVYVNDGSWNLRNIALREPACLASWAMVHLGREDPKHIENYANQQARMLRTCGLRGTPYPHMVSPCPGETLEATMKKAIDGASAAFRQPCQIVVVILPDNGAPLYQEVKRASDHALGVVSQCIVERNVTKPDRTSGKVSVSPQYTANVALKMNAKLGGRNTVVRSYYDSIFQMGPTLLLGADVSHPGAGSGGAEPSIAAVVGSMDHFAFKYSARITQEAHRCDSISHLKECVKDLMRQMVEEDERMPPACVLYYRDGVSEGEFASVLQQEWTALKQAFEELMAELPEVYLEVPTITFIVVQKRHKTRFFPVNFEDGDGKGNVKPGCVVDRDVTLPHGFDFYINSHKGLQGTCRPAHYHVLLDENRFTADKLQQMTFELCHLYSSATTSVSLPPPVYHAHKAAKRGADMLTANDSASEASFGSSLAPQFHDVHINLKDCMFWA